VPGGKYHFKLKVTNAEGKWSDPLIDIPLTVRPPYWLTWWFGLLCLGFVSASVYGVYRYRVQQLKRIYSIKSKISQDLHDDVGASLSSIHIYSSVAENALHQDPQKAEKIVQQIKHNSRQVMENMSDIIWSMNTGKSDQESLVGRIKNYGYDLLSQKNIECRYHIDPAVEKKLQKPEARKHVLLIVKEALNNMAKYSEATQSLVSITIDHTALKVHIEDNGKGFVVNEGPGNGLKNMEQRAKMLGGNLQVTTSPGHGTIIESHIPLANISDS
jgi:signal transduction histidine kinase